MSCPLAMRLPCPLSIKIGGYSLLFPHPQRAVRVRPPAWLGADGAGDTVVVDHEPRRAVDVNETRKYGLMSGLCCKRSSFMGITLIMCTQVQ